jgi:pyridoxamine 5'-phosphate oxidase family protein
LSIADPGRAEAITVDVSPVAPGFFSNEVIWIHPERVISWMLRARDGRAFGLSERSDRP